MAFTFVGFQPTFNNRLVEAEIVTRNCLFRSVADQLCGDAEEHQSYRERCCEHMLDHAEVGWVLVGCAGFRGLDDLL